MNVCISPNAFISPPDAYEASREVKTPIGASQYNTGRCDISLLSILRRALYSREIDLKTLQRVALTIYFPCINKRMRYMEQIADATESIEDFFARYTRYLTEGNIEGLADIYNYPALAVTAMGCLAITEPQQSREFFSQGQDLYHSRQIHGVRARDIVTDIEVPGIWVGRLVLENLDQSGAPVGQERNAYQVVTLPDGTRRIAVSTPLDAYNPDQMSGVE
jgi:hypothetical protein